MTSRFDDINVKFALQAPIVYCKEADDQLAYPIHTLASEVYPMQ